jgi:sugar O-acyltransferase (sialic acid O-acetyltransferase NeuD family)
VSGPIWIAGTRSFAAELLGYASEAGLEVAGLLEPRERDNAGGTIDGLPVAWVDDGPAEPGAEALVGTGDADRREVAERLAAAGFLPATLVHPAAHVPASVEVGEGSIVAPGAVVGAHVQIARQVVIGRGSLIGHHTRIGDLATLGPGSNVAGNTQIGEGAFLGMAAVVRDHVSVGAGAVIAMGAVVVGDMPEGASVRGLPAR